MSPLSNGHANGHANGHSNGASKPLAAGHAFHAAVPTPTSTHHASFAFATRALHVGSEPSLSASSGVIPALDLSTTYQQSHVGVHKSFEYTRSQNPVRLALERLLASLEGADTLLQARLAAEGQAESWDGGPAALAFSSGSAATATVVGGLAGQGGHVVSVADVYGGTRCVFNSSSSAQIRAAVTAALSSGTLTAAFPAGTWSKSRACCRVPRLPLST